MFRAIILPIFRSTRLCYSLWWNAPMLISQIYSSNETLHISYRSSVHHQEFFTVHRAMLYVIQFCKRLASRIKCSSSQAVSKPVWHISLLCVQWKTPDDGQMICPKHVDFHFKNKFEKLVHLFHIIIRELLLCFVTGERHKGSPKWRSVQTANVYIRHLLNQTLAVAEENWTAFNYGQLHGKNLCKINRHKPLCMSHLSCSMTMIYSPRDKARNCLRTARQFGKVNKYNWTSPCVSSNTA